MAERWRAWHEREPIFNSKYRLRPLWNSEAANDGLVEVWRRGTYRRQDQVLERSRENALMSARQYLRKDEPQEFKYREVRCSSRPFHGTLGERNGSTMLNYVEGEGYFTRKRVRENEPELVQRNSRPRSDGVARAFSNCPARDIVEKYVQGGLNQTAGMGFHGGQDEDDELEEGQLTPSTRSSFREEDGCYSISSCRMECENNKALGVVSPLKSRENSCAIDLTPTSKRKKRSKNRMKRERSEMESNVIVVCQGGKNKDGLSCFGVQQQKLIEKGGSAGFLENSSPCQENDGRKEHLTGFVSAFGKAALESSKTVTRVIKSEMAEVEKFEINSAPRSVACLPAANECEALQQEDSFDEDEFIIYNKDSEGCHGRQSLQGDHPAGTFRVSDRRQVQQNLVACRCLRDEVGLSLCSKPVSEAAQRDLLSVGINCQNAEEFNGDGGVCFALDKEVGKDRGIENNKDQGSFVKMHVTEGNIAEVTTSFKENVCVPSKESVLHVSEVESCLFREPLDAQDVVPVQKYLPFDIIENGKSPSPVHSLVSVPAINLGSGNSEVGIHKTSAMRAVTYHSHMHPSYVPLNYVCPDSNLILPSGTIKTASAASECIVPCQNFISTIKECGLQLEDIGDKRELGKPCFTEATTVSRVLPMPTSVGNSAVFLDSGVTNSVDKQLDGMPVTAKSDFPMAKGVIEKFDDMIFMTEPKSSTGFKANQLDNKVLSCMGFFGSYPVVLNDHERPCKNSKYGQKANFKTNFIHESSIPDSQFSVTTEEKCQSLILRSDVHQESSIPQSQGMQDKKMSALNSIEIPLNVKPSTASSQIQPKLAGGLFNRIKTWTWIRSDNIVKPAAEVPNAKIPGRQSPQKAVGSQTTEYVRRGNSLIRASGPPMNLHCTKWGVSGCCESHQQYPKSYTRNMSTSNDVAKTVPNTKKSIVSINDTHESCIDAFIPHTECNTTLEVSTTGSAPSLADKMMTAAAREVEVIHSRSPVIASINVTDRDSPAKAGTSVGSYVTSIPSKCALLVGSNRSKGLMLNSKSKITAHVKGMPKELLSTPLCKSENPTCFINQSSHLQLGNPGHQLLHGIKLAEVKNTTSVQVSSQSSLPASLEEFKFSASKVKQNSRAFLTRLGRVLKQKKFATSLSSQVWDAGHASSSRLPLLQTNKIMPSLFLWKGLSYVVDRSRRNICVPHVSKVSSLFRVSKKLWRLKNRQAFCSRSVDGFSLQQSAFISCEGSNLKWTKSIHKHSENEATMAAAAVEKRRSEEKDSVADVIVDAKEQANSLVAYEGSSHNSDDSGVRCATDVTRIFIPLRLSTSGAKYINVGNGNQLNRDPKSICCALASERVRWSLHTVRSSISKKQHCQVFTRFCRRNKEVGRCPNSHDSENVKICSRFLKGHCSNVDCRLRHKVIPELMADCSYFLQGFCVYETCPYRHVNVSPKAPVCEGFLKGFCADSQKCNKKHTYTCPEYALTGACSERPICRLRHPKIKKSKLSAHVHKRENKYRRHSLVALEGSTHSQSPSTRMNLDVKEKTGVEGASVEDETADYISLSISDEDIFEDKMTKDNLDVLQKGNSLVPFEIELQTDDLDMLLKPVLLLRQKV